MMLNSPLYYLHYMFYNKKNWLKGFGLPSRTRSVILSQYEVNCKTRFKIVSSLQYKLYVM